mmetsp:Transcript_23476/g.65920  ORF Transcript_23476/g.65920 Transcript_23476/m.65920 type:complete len:204 (-) Transcript_23476:429-1040(-)
MVTHKNTNHTAGRIIQRTMRKVTTASCKNLRAARSFGSEGVWHRSSSQLKKAFSKTSTSLENPYSTASVAVVPTNRLPPTAAKNRPGMRPSPFRENQCRTLAFTAPPHSSTALPLAGNEFRNAHPMTYTIATASNQVTRYTPQDMKTSSTTGMEWTSWVHDFKAHSCWGYCGFGANGSPAGSKQRKWQKCDTIPNVPTTSKAS